MFNAHTHYNILDTAQCCFIFFFLSISIYLFHSSVSKCFGGIQCIFFLSISLNFLFSIWPCSFVYFHGTPKRAITCNMNRYFNISIKFKHKILFTEIVERVKESEEGVCYIVWMYCSVSFRLRWCVCQKWMRAYFILYFTIDSIADAGVVCIYILSLYISRFSGRFCESNLLIFVHLIFHSSGSNAVSFAHFHPILFVRPLIYVRVARCCCFFFGFIGHDRHGIFFFGFNFWIYDYLHPTIHYRSHYELSFLAKKKTVAPWHIPYVHN